MVHHYSIFQMQIRFWYVALILLQEDEEDSKAFFVRTGEGENCV